MNRRRESTAVTRSEVDPDFDCVPIDSLTADGSHPTPPPGGAPEPEGKRLCPDGYVPRRRRAPYQLEGKRVVGRGDPVSRGEEAVPPTDAEGTANRPVG